MSHFANFGEERFPEIHKRFQPLWDRIHPGEHQLATLENSSFRDSVIPLHTEHPEFVRCGRANLALATLFEGHPFRKNPREKKWRNVGGLPPMLNSLRDYPEGLAPSLVNELNFWAQNDHTTDKEGLGMVGPYGSGKCQCGVWAICEMFKKTSNAQLSNNGNNANDPIFEIAKQRLDALRARKNIA